MDIIVPTPVGMVIALDGDGASAAVLITLVEGFPASSTQIRYHGAAEAGNDAIRTFMNDWRARLDSNQRPQA